MKSRNYLVRFVIGFGVGLQVTIATAQRDAGADADVPELAGETTPSSATKALGPNRDAAKASAAQNDNRPRSTVRTFRSTNLLGTTIANAEGRAVGKVVDFVTDTQGNVLYPLVTYSGTPGYSGKLFAIPYSSLRFGVNADGNSTAQLSFDPRLLERAPNFASGRFPDFGDPILQNKLNSFYQQLLPASSTGAGLGGSSVVAGSTGVRTAAVNPALPLTSSVAAPSLPGGSVIGPSGSPAGSTSGASIIGPSGSPAGSTSPGGSVVGPSGTPGGIPAGTATGSPPTPAVPGASVIGPSGSSASSNSSERSIIGSTGSPASGTPGTAGNTESSTFMLRSSQMAGMPIQDASGNVTGKVVDFVTDGSGNSRYAVVSLAGDSRNIIVPTGALNLQAGSTGSNFAMLRLTPQDLQGAPAFTGNTWPNFSNPGYTNGINSFYQPSTSLFNNGTSVNAVAPRSTTPAVFPTRSSAAPGLVPGASIIDATGSPASSTSGEGSIVGSTGSPASGTPLPAGNTTPVVNAGTNSTLFPGRSSTTPGSPGVRTNKGVRPTGQLFPRAKN